MSSRPYVPHTAATASSPVRRADAARGLTSEHIGAHVAAFEAAGGKVEVLETTQVLKRIQPDATDAVDPAKSSGASSTR